MKKYFFILILGLSSLHLFSQETQSKVIKWDSIPGVNQYQFILFHDDLQIMIYDCPVPEIELLLAEGNYSYHITYVNKFGKQSFLTRDEPLIIETIHSPVLLENPHLKVYENRQPDPTEIKLQYFNHQGIIHLFNSNKTYSLDFSVVDADTFLISWPERLQPGQYSLKVENSNGSEADFERFLSVLPIFPPEITKSTPDKLEISTNFSRIEIQGKYFSQNLNFQISNHRTQDQFVPFWTMVSQEQMYLWIPTQIDIPGFYDLQVRTPWDEEIVYEKFIQLISPEIITDNKERKKWGMDLLFAYTGLKIEKEVDPLLALELQLRMDSAIDRIVLRNIGLILQNDFERAEDNSVYFSHGIGLYYRTRFDFPVNLSLAGLYGIKWDNHFSNGPYWETQGAISIQTGNVLIEPVLKLQQWYSQAGNLQSAFLGICLGYRF